MVIKKIKKRDQIPLCIDLDGTLYRGDFFLEQLSESLLKNPGVIFRSLAKGVGIASLKEELHAQSEIQMQESDFRSEVLDRLKREARSGRKIYLVTAAYESVARQVANYFGFFSGVLATQENANLKGRRKMEQLVQRFGRGGYEYWGDSPSDRHALEAAYKGFWVNRSSGKLEPWETGGKSGIGVFMRNILHLIRPHQWTKNLLVFVPLLASGLLQRQDLWSATFLAFVSFCLVASAGYLCNDLLDVRADRRHQHKCGRPLASGALTFTQGVVVFLFLTGGAVGLGLLNAPGVQIILLGYFLLSLIYSTKLKKVELLDIFCLSALYLLRVVAGGVAAETQVSSWLFMFVGFGFCGMAAFKRQVELQQFHGSAKMQRRGYLGSDGSALGQVGFVGLSTAGLILTLYARSPEAGIVYRHPERLMLAGFLWFGWSSWLALMVARQKLPGDPVQFCLRDRVSWICLFLGLAIYFWAKMG
jgi:4-hydroxybenzoate polyprenyltransferase